MSEIKPTDGFTMNGAGVYVRGATDRTLIEVLHVEQGMSKSFKNMLYGSTRGNVQIGSVETAEGLRPLFLSTNMYRGRISTDPTS